MNADPSSPLSWIVPIIIIVLLVLFSAFFSLTETAFTCMNQFKIKVLADDGNKSAKVALKLYEKFDNTLISVLVGNNVVAVLVSVFSTLFFVWFFALIGIEESIASIVATIVMTIVVYLFGDTIPKFISKSIPDKVVLKIAYVAYFFLILFTPFSIIFKGLTILANKIFKSNEKPTLTEEEFTDIIENIEEEGILEENESEIIQNSLDFDDTKVIEVYTKKSKMFSIDIEGLTHDSLKEILLQKEYSRIPVYERDENNIIGVLHVRSYLKEFSKNKNLSIRNVLQKPYFVYPGVKLETIFEGFKRHKTHLAIVRNSDDEILGIVTLDDVLEELVGDIHEKNFKKREEK